MKPNISKKMLFAIPLTCYLLSATLLQASTLEGYATLNGGTSGGQGGETVYASSGTEINEAMCNRATEETPLIIYVNGTINHANTTKVSGRCDTSSDEIQFKRVKNISLIGVEDNALFDEIGIHIREASNIIIQNIHVRNVKKSGSPISNGGDAIGIESDVSNIWIDHNELEASGGESAGYDSLIDMKANTQYVTVSYNYLHHSGRGGLIGSSDSDTNNTFVTFHHNYYEHIDSRMPLLRHGTAHAFNNYYNHVDKSGMNPRIGGQIKAENNYFQNAHNPIGTFYTNEMGYWDLSGNTFENVTWNEKTKEHPAGPNPVSTTTITVPYSYTLDATECVRSIVLTTAGAGKNLATSNGQCGTVPPEGPDPEQPEPTDPEEPTTPVTGNLSLNAGADGSSKGMGSYGNVIDGDLTTFWSPVSTPARISVKWQEAKTVNTIVIREAEGQTGNIGNWELIDHDTGDLLATGNGAGSITFSAITSTKLNFNITSANGTPTVAEFESYFEEAQSDDSDLVDPGSEDSDSGDSNSNNESPDDSNSGADNSNTSEDQVVSVSIGATPILILLFLPILLVSRRIQFD